jgi:ABC-type uncharacterized transport system fused permease/ATPase subunit
VHAPAVGNVMGRFYQVFVDIDRTGFVAAVCVAAPLYGAIVLAKSISVFVGQLLIIRWRRRISTAVHAHYFAADTFCHLQQQAGDWAQQDGGLGADSSLQGNGPNCMDQNEAKELHSAGLVAGGLAGAEGSATAVWCDNPDQRMAEDVQLFAEALEYIFRNTAMVPVILALYSFLCTRQFQSAMPVLAALSFFLANAMVHRSIVAAYAASVYTREAAEGNFRAVHMRVLSHAGPIAAWQGSAVEAQHVHKMLETVLGAQFRLACWQSAQTLVAKVRTVTH